MSIVRTSSLLAAAALVAACTNSSPGGADPGTAGPQSAGGAPSGGATSSSGGATSSSGGAPSHSFGTISVSQSLSSAGYDVSAGASFGLASETAARYCQDSTDGACTVRVCDLPGGVSGGGGSGTSNPTAGAVTIEGGSDGPIVLQPRTIAGIDGLYSGYDGSSRIFSPGAQLTVSAAGADCPAFSGKSVVAPADITLTNDLSKIDPSHDLDLVWTGGGADGKVVVDIHTMTQSATGAHTAAIACSFDPKSGKGTVPQTALSKLGKCDGAMAYCFASVLPQSDTTFTAGDYEITFGVQATGQDLQRFTTP